VKEEFNKDIESLIKNFLKTQTQTLERKTP
jgi:hypothetical protein